MHILVVEDEISIREVVESYLIKEGWQVDCTSDGYEAVRMFDYSQHDLIILDLKLEGLPGEEVCRKIREKSSVPIIMLTSKSRESDLIQGLNLGADDYIVKPFRVKELIARIQALMRRIEPEKGSLKVFTLKHNKLMVNQESKEVILNGKHILLTETEFKLLSVLVKKPKKIFSRNDLSYLVQGYRAESGRTIDAHVKNLRKKIEEDSKNPQYIITLVGFGYQFAVTPDE